MNENIKVKRWEDSHKKKLGKKYFGLRVFDGENRPKSKFFETRLDREQWVQDWQVGLNSGTIEVSNERGKTKVRDITVSKCVEAYLHEGEKSGWRQITYRTRRQRLGQFVEFLGDRSIKKIERRDAIDFIELMKTNESRRSMCNDVVAFLNWCGNEDRGRTWIPPFKFSKLQWLKLKEDEKEVGILYPDECRDLIMAMPDKYKAGLALALFTGVRPYGELMGMVWADVNFRRERITVRSEIAKTRKRRVMSDLPGNLWAWLERYRKESGSIVPSYNGYNLCRRRLCQKLEINYASDAARHSFASYGYWRGEEWARRTMGHTKTSDIFHRVYVDAGPSREESEEYFGIMPE